MPIHHQRFGVGKPVILLHGFPMNATVWSAFAPRFGEGYSLITPDLPGFGESDLLTQPFSISDVGDAMNEFVESNSLAGAALIGHSLGGYVALEMIGKRPEWFSSLVLFHSTALPDTEEKKISRSKVVEFVSRNGAEAFTSSFIGPLFADPQHPGVETVRKISANASAEAVIGYTIAMRDRLDQTTMLRSLQLPVLFVCGDKDAGIPVDSIMRQAELCAYPTVRVLRDAGHMSMFEDPEAASAAILDFLAKKNI